MRHFIAIALLFCLSVALPVHAAEWTQKEKGTIQGLSAITKIADQWFAVGNTGNVIHSTDGGSTWQLFQQSGSVYWQDIETFGSKMWMIGGSGTIRESADNGKTWSQLSFGIAEHLYDIDASAQYGYVVGTDGRILSFSPSIGQWSVINPPTTLSLYGVYNLNNGHAWAVGAQGIYVYTMDAGANWTVKGKIAQTDLYAVWTDGTKGFAVGKNGYVMRTIDGGVSWAQISITGLGSQTLYDIEGIGSELVIVGDKVILRSTDAGTTWTLEDFSSQGYTFKDVYFPQAGEVWVAGTKDDVQSVIMNLAIQSPAQPETTTNPTTETQPDPAPITTPATPTTEVSMGSLIKMVCANGAGVTDPCRAVYYYAADGKRHAFPNENIFFTWFENFNSVKEVSASFLASLPLGKNVTYHPGTKMVKFQSVPTVYAVSQKGVLRAIASEEVAMVLYGAQWNKWIDDLSDAFVGNYTFGSKIQQDSDFDVASERSSIKSLNDNF